jgi:hypothetical protein
MEEAVVLLHLLPDDQTPGPARNLALPLFHRKLDEHLAA